MRVPETWPGEEMQTVQRLKERLTSAASASIAVVLILGVSLSCSQAREEFDLLQSLPIPEGAREARKIALGGSQKNQQLFFIVERTYPARDVLDLYDNYFAREKWIACHGLKDDWDSFADESTRPARHIYRITSFWVRPDRRAYALVSGMYYSAASAPSRVPDNSEQRWAILVQKDVDAIDEAKRLSLNCG